MPLRNRRLGVRVPLVAPQKTTRIYRVVFCRIRKQKNAYVGIRKTVGFLWKSQASFGCTKKTAPVWALFSHIQRAQTPIKSQPFSFKASKQAIRYRSTSSFPSALLPICRGIISMQIMVCWMAVRSSGNPTKATHLQTP